MQIPGGDLDFLAIGEALVDLISLEMTDSLAEARRFERFQGGSPANIAANIAKLGGRAALIARVGAQAFGPFVQAELARVGVMTDYMILDPAVHTSLVFVSRTRGTPDFEPIRSADFMLSREDVAPQVVQRARIVHTSSWPLSREPARSAVEYALKIARDAGKIISLDPNYSPRIWPDVDEALAVLERMLGYATITKPSLDDAIRLWGEGLLPEAYIARFHALGPQVVVLTMGAQGILVSDRVRITYIPAQKLNVVDATGAGDAFWAGFLVALLDGNSLKRCALFAREVVGVKLAQVGPLPQQLDRAALYQKIEAYE